MRPLPGREKVNNNTTKTTFLILSIIFSLVLTVLHNDACSANVVVFTVYTFKFKKEGNSKTMSCPPPKHLSQMQT